MSDNNSDGEQSEDGELRHSLEETKNEDDFSMPEEGEAIDDVLDIKPPQARIASQSHPNERDDLHSLGLDKHRDDRYSHRVKRHRSGKDREGVHYRRNKDRYYVKQYLGQLNYDYESSYRDRIQDSRLNHSEALWKDEEEKQQGSSRDVRYSREVEKRKTEHYKDAKRSSKIDKALKAVLRERLIKTGLSSKADDLWQKEKSHRNRKHKEHEFDPLRAGQLVREIISLTTEVRKHRNKEKEDKEAEDERAEHEQRRGKLLEAKRAMARLKEQSRLERKRRYLEKALKRKLEEDIYMKKSRIEEPQVVTLSDNSDIELGEIEEDASADSPGNSKRSRSVSRHSDGSKNSYESDTSRDEIDSAYSRRNSRTRSGSFSKSRTRSLTPSHNQPIQSEEEDMIVEKDKKTEKNVEKEELDEDFAPYYPALRGCRSVEEFDCLNKIDEGTYGVVYRARDKRTGDIVALKKLKMEREKEGFPITSLREINTLLKGQHPNIVTVREIVVGGNLDNIFIVMDYVEHDLKSLMETMRHKKQTFMPGQIKCLLKQLLIAMQYLHDNWILHRDLKTSNLLLSHKGILKVGDFGLAREYGSPLKAYTPSVVTRWYRAPELLLCTKEYSTPIDMWSVGCIFAELLLMNPLFPGKSEIDQLNRIFKVLGTPSEKIWSGFNQLPAVKLMKFNEYPVSNLRNKFRNLSEAGLGLLIKLLTFDPAKRITAEEALKHAYFTEPPLPTDPEMFPTWPAKSELGVKRAAMTSPKPPSGGGQYKKLERDDAYGFRIGIGVDPRREGPGFSLKF